LERAAAVLTISDFVRGRAPAVVRDRLVVVDNPVSVAGAFDRASDAAWLRSEFGLPPDARVVVKIANGNARKRWEMFFKAASMAARADPRLHFLSVGLTIKSEINTYMRRYFQGPHAANMHILGYRYDAPRIISGSDALVSTAKDEPLGRTIIEAGSLGVPMIVSDAGGHTELLSSLAPACLVGEQRAHAFAERMREIDTFARDYAASAPLVAAEMRRRFDPRRHVSRILEEYARIGLAAPV
jgi:glycosyltransferase involved in cell wall biosynthesis